MSNTQQDRPGIRVIPPLLYLAALAVAFLLDWLRPVALLPDTAQYVVGGVLAGSSFLAMGPITGAFRRAGTPFDVRRPASALVTDGPYRYSRNPGYVALIVFCLGIAVLADNVWVLPLVALATWVLTRFVVIKEERHLEARFGDAYRDYSRRVRRWL